MTTQAPWFPCHAITFEHALEDVQALVAGFLEIRPDASWLLLAFDAAASERHLWTAWLAMRRGYADGSAISRNADAEFLRLLSGTHQIRIGFERAGLASGDERAWLLRLPETMDDGVLPTTEWRAFSTESQPMINMLGARLMPNRPEPTLAGLNRLCIEYHEQGANTSGEKLFLGHIIAAQTSA